MKKLKLILITIFPLFLLTGCGNGFSDETYSHQSNPSDPTLTFKSDYDGYTYFWLNNDSPAEKRLCSNTHPIGYLFHSDSIFVFEKNVTQIDVKIPAEKEITIIGSYGDGSSSCGPINKAFIPEKNKNYIIQYERAGNYCRLNVIDQNTGDEVDSRKVGVCTK